MGAGLLQAEHAWFPKTTCDERCVSGGNPESPLLTAIRTMSRIIAVAAVLCALPVLAVPMPGRTGVQRGYCRLMLRCIGVRVSQTGNPIRNLPGVLVVSNHTSWVDVFALGAVVPGSFVARADLVD